ncbi:hypothetical protein M153_8760001354 [Pseudoloma neurophilia]|uniref:Uncharacterized protein n=1 Tax=Pseudoloma neurophilia TaxID=146866 RepID=A0A0R0M214_9MICR|nr:hypothetical protein M153_8760001354 [Pseudoloma neurophilia]
MFYIQVVYKSILLETNMIEKSIKNNKEVIKKIENSDEPETFSVKIESNVIADNSGNISNLNTFNNKNTKGLVGETTDILDTQKAENINMTKMSLENGQSSKSPVTKQNKSFKKGSNPPNSNLKKSPKKKTSNIFTTTISSMLSSLSLTPRPKRKSDFTRIIFDPKTNSFKYFGRVGNELSLEQLKQQKGRVAQLIKHYENMLKHTK